MPNRDQFTTDIYVNGDQARDALAKLETELDKLRKQSLIPLKKKPFKT